MREDGSNTGVGGVDFDVLTRLGRRLANNPRFESVAYRPEYAPNSVVGEFDLGYYPAAVTRASLRVEWFESDDFHVHYAEEFQDGSRWECRWDRHPNDHNSREHFHPPPAAATPAQDCSHPRDWRDLMTDVLEDIDRRIRAFWE